MIRPIKIYNDKFLRKLSMPITKKYKGLNQLIDDMFETMHKAGGIGLAAVQIGIPIRLFVIEVHHDDLDFKGVFINPNIMRFGEDKVKHPEGCLSIPFLSGVVERPDDIFMTYYDREWKKQEVIFRGLEARVIQHEYEHLQGDLFIDSLNSMWSSMLDSSLRSIEDGSIKPPYLI